MNYRQLSFGERYLIDAYWNCKKLSMSQIANELGRSKLTTLRKLKRNSREATYWYEMLNQKKYEDREMSFLFNLLKYEEFTNKFMKFYNKYYRRIEASWAKVKKLNLQIKMPSWRQVFNWAKYYAWALNEAKRLSRKYKKVRKKKN